VTPPRGARWLLSWLVPADACEFIEGDLVEEFGDAWRQNLNHLRFEFTSAASPRDAGLSGDPRALAVLFEMIAIERQVPPR
jgi:hypothetical protein